MIGPGSDKNYTPKCTRLTVSLPHDPARPCLGLVVIKSYEIQFQLAEAVGLIFSWMCLPTIASSKETHKSLSGLNVGVWELRLESVSDIGRLSDSVSETASHPFFAFLPQSGSDLLPGDDNLKVLMFINL